MAYLEIAGERMPVDGLPLSDGFLYLDRGVMGGMLYGGYVSWESQDGAPYFKLTAKGRRLLLPILS
ncbi:hypothetical protein [uncultured Caulobacter sp.]|uniref:hypothetical protein n=1 Tax=uncultured Caulobacter sp. TaxID=158749 RepID=UPI00262D7829|nr:hypothetical protein [uncultured Caulobacter sp.]